MDAVTKRQKGTIFVHCRHRKGGLKINLDEVECVENRYFFNGKNEE